MVIPTKINDTWIPKNTEVIPKRSIPTISHNLETNSPTHEIVHSSLWSVQSDMYAETTGRISESPNDIANVIIIIFRNHSLYPSNI